MELKMTGETFKDLITIMKMKGDHEVVRVSANRDGLHIAFTDLSHVFMAILNVPKGSFLEYSCDDPMEFAFELDMIYWGTRPYKKDDTIKVTVGERLDVEKNNNVKFSMPTADVDTVPPVKEIELHLENYFVISLQDLKEALASTDLIAEGTLFVLSKNRLEIDAEDRGEERKKETVYYSSTLKEFVMKKDDPIIAEYPTDFLVKMVRTMKSDYVRIALDTDYPMQMDFDLKSSSGWLEPISVRYLLAPRIRERE